MGESKGNGTENPPQTPTNMSALAGKMVVRGSGSHAGGGNNGRRRGLPDAAITLNGLPHAIIRAFPPFVTSSLYKDQSLQQLAHVSD